MQLEITKREAAILAMALRGLLETTCRTAPCGPQHLTAEALEQKLESLMRLDSIDAHAYRGC